MEEMLLKHKLPIGSCCYLHWSSTGDIGCFSMDEMHFTRRNKIFNNHSILLQNKITIMLVMIVQYSLSHDNTNMKKHLVHEHYGKMIKYKANVKEVDDGDSGGR